MGFIKKIIGILFFIGIIMCFVGGGTRGTPMRDRNPKIALFGGCMALVTLLIMVVPQIVKDKHRRRKK